MSGGSELATGYVTITASAEGLGRSILDIFAQTDRVAQAAGVTAGRQFAAGVTAGAGGLSSLLGQQFTQAGAAAGNGIQAGITQGAAAGLSGLTGQATAAGNQAGAHLGAGISAGVAHGAATGLGSISSQATSAGTQAGNHLGTGIQSGVSQGVQQGLSTANAAAASAGHSSGSRFSAAFSEIAGTAIGEKIGEGISGSLGGALENILGAQDASAKLTAQLSLSADEAKRFGEDAKDLFGGNFAGSLSEANDAIRSVVSNIGGMRDASSKDLQAITGKVTSLASAFDQDLGSVTKAVGQQIKTGLAKNADEALDNIAAGFQHGVDKSEDFLDTLNEYGVQFQKLGIDGKTATGLLSQGLQAGARDADLVADALKEFSIRAIDGSQTTIDGFTKLGLNAQQTGAQVAKGGDTARAATDGVLASLRAVEDPARRAAIATELFGTQSEDLGKALFSLDLKSAASGLGDVAGAATKVTDGLGGTASGAITSFWNQLQNTATTIGEDLLPVVMPLLGAVSGITTGFLALPGPVKASAIALVALAVAGPKVAQGIRFLRQEMALATYGQGLFAGGWAKLGKLLAGGAIFAGVAFAVSEISGAMAKQKAVTDDLSAASKSLSDVLTDQGGRWDALAEKTLTASVTGSDNFQKLQTAGASYGDVIDLVTGKTKDAGKVLSEIDFKSLAPEDASSLLRYVNGLGSIKTNAITADKEIRTYNTGVEAQKQILVDAKAEQDRYVGSLQAAGAAQKAAGDGGAAYVASLQAAGVVGREAAVWTTLAASGTDAFGHSIDEGRLAVANGTGAFAALTDEFVRMTPAARAGAKEQGSWNLLMKQAAGDTDEASQSLALFSFAVDQLSGRNRTSEETTKNLNDQVRAIAAAFTDGTKATDGNIESLISASGAIDTTTEAGSNLYDSLNNYRTAADQSTDAAYENAVAAGNQAGALKLARDAADDARQKFLDQAKALGINEEAARKMADKLGILEGSKLTDKDFSIIATDKASGPIADVKKGLADIPDKTVTLTVKTATTQASTGLEVVPGGGKFATGGLIRGAGTGTSDSILIAASDGEGVNTAAAMSHRENRAAMHYMNAGGVIQGFAKGGLVINMGATGQAGADAARMISGLYSSADTYAAKTKKDVQTAEDAQAAAVPASSTGVQQWAQIFAQALRMTGDYTTANLAAGLHQMDTESGGNPAAINLYDINAQNGVPSKGLMQVIPPTFAAYAQPGYNSNIYDPLSNILASINYTKAQYGSLLNGWRGVAYATGGLIRGAGTGTSDSILIAASDGEGVNTAAAMSHRENRAAMHYMNRGGVIPGFANGGLVSSRELAGIADQSYGDRQGRVVAAITGISDEVAQARTAAHDTARAAAEAAKALVAAHAEQKRATKEQKKAADAQVVAAQKVADSTRVQAQAAGQNFDAAVKTQKQLQASYRSLSSLAARYDSLDTRIATAASRVDAAQGALASTQQSKSQAISGFASSIAGFDGGLTGHSDLRLTSRSVVGGLQHDLSVITGFQKDLAGLSKKGASAQVLNELTREFGSGGEVTAHALNSGPTSDLRAAQTLLTQISKVSTVAATYGPAKEFEPIIKQQSKVVADLTAGYQKLLDAQRVTDATLRRLAPDVTKAVHDALNKVTWVQSPQGTWKVVQQGQKEAGRRG